MKIRVCKGKVCGEKFSNYIISRLQNDVNRFNLKDIEIEETLCMGKCSEGPNVYFDNEFHTRVNPLKASKILFKKVKK
ncbi:(2Fe-2S) ferredoxin domain-containing protein [Candidatus Gracilibacteria bacterium]|nr:(2Fe-2S) ferredoxin domain-containing protein [Candidatus Gracilibacteria bacterium]